MNIINIKINSYKTILLLIYISIIIYAAFDPVVIFKNQWRYDVYIHFIEYFILGFLFVNAIRVDGENYYRIQTLIFLLTFSIFDEGLQYFVPHRVSSLKDIIVDIFGGISGASVKYYFIKRLIYKNDF